MKTKHLLTHLLALCGTIVLNCVLLSVLVPAVGSLLGTLFLDNPPAPMMQTGTLEQPPFLLSFLVWGPPVVAFLTGLFLWMRHLTAVPRPSVQRRLQAPHEGIAPAPLSR